MFPSSLPDMTDWKASGSLMPWEIPAATPVSSALWTATEAKFSPALVDFAPNTEPASPAPACGLARTGASAAAHPEESREPIRSLAFTTCQRWLPSGGSMPRDLVWT